MMRTIKNRIQAQGSKLYVAVGLLSALLLALSLAFPMAASGDRTCAGYDDHGDCNVWLCTGSIEECSRS